MAEFGHQKPSLQSRYKKWSLFFSIIVALVAFLYFTPKEYWTLANIKEQKELLKEFVDRHYFLSVLAYIAAHVLTAFFVPGEILLVIVGGFLFGMILAALYTNMGMTFGATLAFLSACSHRDFGLVLGPLARLILSGNFLRKESLRHH